MSADRKAKMKKQEERDRRQRAKWVETYERILPLVGAKDLFQRLPETTREHIRRLRFPNPEVCCGDDLNRADERENVREAVTQALDQFTFKTSDGHEIWLGIAFGSFSLFGRRSTNYGWNPLMAPSLSWRRKPGRNWGQCAMS